MVNKQYNVHNPKLHKSKSGGSPPPVRNFPEVSNLPNPSTGSSSGSLENNLNHVTERHHHHHHHHHNHSQNQQLLQNNLDMVGVGDRSRRRGTASPPSDEDFGEDGVYGRNISYYSEAAQLGGGGASGSNERLSVKDLADISDIGRFQYILQMDREVGTPYSGYTTSSSPTQNCPNSSAPNSLPSHLHTSRQSYNFWKASGSQSPLTSASSINSFFRPSVHSRGCFRRTLHQIWRFLKWPLGLLLICSLLGLVVYFLVVDRDIMSSSLLGDGDVYNVEENLSIDFNDFTHTNDLDSGPVTTFGRDHKDNAIGFSKDGATPNSKFSFGLNNDLLAVLVKKTNNGEGQNTFWTSTSTEHESLSEETPAQVVKVLSSTTTAPIRKTSTISLKDYTKGRVQFDEDEVFEVPADEHTTRAIDDVHHHHDLDGGIQRNLTAASSSTSTTGITTSTTDSSLYRTKVSPTLPILSRFEITTEGLKRFNISEEGTAPTSQLDSPKPCRREEEEER